MSDNITIPKSQLTHLEDEIKSVKDMLAALNERLNIDHGDSTMLLRDAVKKGFEQIEQGEGVLHTDTLFEELRIEAHNRARDGKAPKSDVTP